MSTSHVLVVDDEGDIRALIDEILSDEGYEVTVAADAAEARTARRLRHRSTLNGLRSVAALTLRRSVLRDPRRL